MTEVRSWRVAAASVEGTSHTKQGLHCQDAMAVKIFKDGDGHEVLVIVVSDGAGSAARSEVGSSLACSIVSEAVEVFLAEGRSVSDIGLGAARSWLAMVRDAIQDRAEADGEAIRDYACTLLVTVVGKEAAAIAQIGDGAIVISDGDGWAWAHWPQHGEYLNTTFFVTSDDAEGHLAFDLCQRRIDEIAVFSDGIEGLVLHHATKTVFAPFFDRMMPAVRTSQFDGLDRNLSDALVQYLASPVVCARTDDDKTLVLATRRAPIVVATMPSVETQAESAPN